MIQLRPYQAKAVEDMRAAIRKGMRRLVLCAPTGAGKTVIFSYMCKSAYDKGKRALIVTDRTELMTQSGGALSGLGLIPEQIRSGHEPNLNGKLLYTAMVETLARRMSRTAYQQLLASFDLIIFDEAHKQAFNKLFPYISPDTVVIGATATPHRERNQACMSEFYDGIVEAAKISELIDMGFLAQPLTFSVPVDLSGIKMRGGDYDEKHMGQMYAKRRVWQGVAEQYNKICPGEKALLFASSIEASKDCCEHLVECGINARHLDSEMGAYERAKILAWYKREPDAVLCNVGILTTGFDAPDTKAVILYRATKSLPLFLQMCGRGSRRAPGKDSFKILDFGENIREHLYWELDRNWTLEKAPKRSKKKGAAPVKGCPQCNAMLYASARSCGYCGYEFKRDAEAEAIAELQLMNPRERRDLARGLSLEEKAVMAKAGLIKPHWVLHTLQSYEEGKRFGELMGWKWKGWYFHNQHRFPNLKKRETA